MSDFKKTEWAPPELRHFDTPEELWAYYAPKATPEELAALERLMRASQEVRER